MNDLLFEVRTPIGFTVRCTTAYWKFIVSEKHPALEGHEDDIRKALTDPDEVRRSRKDARVYLFYREPNHGGSALSLGNKITLDSSSQPTLRKLSR